MAGGLPTGDVGDLRQPVAYSRDQARRLATCVGEVLLASGRLPSAYAVEDPARLRAWEGPLAYSDELWWVLMGTAMALELRVVKGVGDIHSPFAEVECGWMTVARARVTFRSSPFACAGALTVRIRCTGPA